LELIQAPLIWPAGAEGTAADQETLQDVQQKLEEKKKVLQEAKLKEQESLKKLVVITSQLKNTEKALRSAHQKLAVNESQLRQLSKEIVDTEADLTKKAKTLKARIREIYKGSHVNYLELVFSSKSMGEFLSSSFYFGRVLEKDSNLINQIATEFQDQKKKKMVLGSVTKTNRQTADEISEKKENISSLAEEEKKVYDSLKSRREEYERQVSELEESSKQLEKLITQRIVERAKTGGSAPVGTGKFHFCIWL
jgi:peptidoglycan hydrolase CwlO-like protein